MRSNYIMVITVTMAVWPDQLITRKTMPGCFKPTYSRVTCIIDRPVVFIEKLHPFL